MPTLLQINVCLNLSTGNIAQRIGELAIQKGWESWIAYSSRASTIQTKSKTIRIGSKMSPYIHYMEYRLFDREGLSSRKSTKELINFIEKLNPNIIHLHNIHDHWLNYDILFDYIGKHHIPVVWTQHDCWSFTGGCSYFDLLKCEHWKEECACCPEKRSLINNSWRNFKKKETSINKIEKLVFVPVSNWLADIMRMSVLQNKSIVTIHNGIDTNLFRPINNKETTSNKFEILGVAAVWNERKGLDDFYKLREILSDEYEMTLVGLNNKQIQNLPPNIKGITRTSRVDELIMLYSEANVFVNPTYSDNFPTTNIEALACGTPVITYNTGGSPEAIDEQTGIVIDVGNVEGLATAIKQLRVSPFNRNNCRKRAEMFFNNQNCYKKYFDIYYSLINK